MRLFLLLLPLIASGLFSSPARAAGPCADFYARLPNVSRALCDEALLQPSHARSVKGRILYARDVPAESARRRVLVVGAMHGDELTSASVALHWIKFAQAAQTKSQTHWLFIPALNPDGLLSRPSSRVNANGVDLNRNFPTPDWEKETAVYWDKRVRKDPRRWPGKTSLSEPESRYLYDEIKRFQPHLIVSIHAPYGVLDFDGPVRAPSRLGHLHLNQVGIFPGSLGNFGGVQNGMPVVTVELPNALKTPTDVEIKRMWNDLQRWMEDTITPTITARAPSPMVR
jgi:protein MpaA